MPNNFRISGNLYVSKKGDDLNAGTDPNLPKKTIQSAADAAVNGNTIVVGAGDYTEGLTTNTVVNIRFDGTVVIRYNGADNLFLLGASSSFIADNAGNVEVIGFAGSNSVLFNNGTDVFGVVFDSCEFGGASVVANFDSCAFVSCQNNASANQRIDCNQCVFIDSTLGTGLGNDGFSNCYMDATTTTLSVVSDAYTNNNCQGTANVGGVDYSLYFDATGAAVSPTPPNPDIIAVFADIYTNRDSFNDNASFYKVTKRDFITVLASSVLLRRGASLVNIGGVVYGSGFDTSIADFYPGISAVDLALQSGDIVTTSTLGICTTGSLSHAPTVTGGRKFLRIIPASLKRFDTDQAIGTAGNNNVLAVDDYSGTAGENPKRLTIEMRWSVSATAPDPNVDAEWDNDTSNTGIAAGTWTKFEVGGLASIDASGRGRGDEDFVQAEAAEIRATYYQYRYTIREGIS